MTRDVLSPKIFEKIVKDPRVRRMNTGSVRNAVSEFHKRNPGISMNAAAYLFGRSKGFSVYKSLTPEDKKSLQFVKSNSEPATSANRKVTPRRPDIRPDFDSPFVSDANDNAEAYLYIYLLENGLRQTILDKFGTDPGWWNDVKRVPPDIQTYASRILDAEKKFPWIKKRADHPLYYVGLYELFRIIEQSWQSFRAIFSDLESLRTWMKEIVPIRNYVAHNIRTRPQERQNVKIRTDYVCRLIEKYNLSKAERDQI
jgi:hypothetical protein